MYWDIEGLACVLEHRGFGVHVYWDIEGLACVYWNIEGLVYMCIGT